MVLPFAFPSSPRVLAWVLLLVSFAATPSPSDVSQQGSTVEPPVSTIGISQSQELVDTRTVAASHRSFWAGVCPCPAPVPEMALRQYKVATFDWTSGTGFGELVTTLNFPYLLTQIASMPCSLKWARFMRAGVEVELRFNGSQFMSGALMVSWDPATAINAVASSDSNIYTSSGFPHVLVSANTSSAVKITVPYVHPSPFFAVTNARPDEIASFDVSVAAPLRGTDAATTPTLKVSVFARFIDLYLDSPTKALILSAAVPTPRTFADVSGATLA